MIHPSKEDDTTYFPPTKRIRFETVATPCEVENQDDRSDAPKNHTACTKPIKSPKSILKPINPNIQPCSSESDASPQKSQIEMLEQIMKQLSSSSDVSSHIDAYRMLQNNLRAFDLNGRDSVIAILPRLQEFIRRDVQNGLASRTVAVQALKLCRILLVDKSDITDHLDTAFRSWLFEDCMKLLCSPTPDKEFVNIQLFLLNSPCLYGSWFSSEVALKMVEQFCKIHTRVPGAAIQSVRLMVFNRIFVQHFSYMSRTIRMWLPIMIHSLLSNNARIRANAVTFGQRASDALSESSSTPQVMLQYLDHQEGNYDQLKDRLLQLFRSSSVEAMDVPKIWITITKFLRSAPHYLQGWARLSDWLFILQYGFNSSNPSLNLKCLDAWNQLISMVKPNIQTKNDLKRAMCVPIFAILQRRHVNDPLIRVREAAWSSYCLTLFYGFAPYAKEGQWLDSWQFYVERAVNVNLRKNEWFAGRLGQVMSTLLHRSEARIWNDSLIQRKKVQLDDVPKLQPQWVRDHLQGSILNPLVEVMCHLKPDDSTELWDSLLTAIKEATIREVQESSITAAVKSAIGCALFRLLENSRLCDLRKSFKTVLLFWKSFASSIITLGPGIASESTKTCGSSINTKNPLIFHAFELTKTEIQRFQSVDFGPSATFDELLRSMLILTDTPIPLLPNLHGIVALCVQIEDKVSTSQGGLLGFRSKNRSAGHSKGSQQDEIVQQDERTQKDNNTQRRDSERLLQVEKERPEMTRSPDHIGSSPNIPTVCRSQTIQDASQCHQQEICDVRNDHNQVNQASQTALLGEYSAGTITEKELLAPSQGGNQEFGLDGQLPSHDAIVCHASMTTSESNGDARESDEFDTEQSQVNSRITLSSVKHDSFVDALPQNVADGNAVERDCKDNAERAAASDCSSPIDTELCVDVQSPEVSSSQAGGNWVLTEAPGAFVSPQTVAIAEVGSEMQNEIGVPQIPDTACVKDSFTESHKRETVDLELVTKQPEENATLDEQVEMASNASSDAGSFDIVRALSHSPVRSEPAQVLVPQTSTPEANLEYNLHQGERNIIDSGPNDANLRHSTRKRTLTSKAQANKMCIPETVDRKPISKDKAGSSVGDDIDLVAPSAETPTIWQEIKRSQQSSSRRGRPRKSTPQQHQPRKSIIRPQRGTISSKHQGPGSRPARQGSSLKRSFAAPDDDESTSSQGGRRSTRLRKMTTPQQIDDSRLLKRKFVATPDSYSEDDGSDVLANSEGHTDTEGKSKRHKTGTGHESSANTPSSGNSNPPSRSTHAFSVRKRTKKAFPMRSTPTQQIEVEISPKANDPPTSFQENPNDDDIVPPQFTFEVDPATPAPATAPMEPEASGSGRMSPASMARAAQSVRDSLKDLFQDVKRLFLGAPALRRERDEVEVLFEEVGRELREAGRR